LAYTPCDRARGLRPIFPVRSDHRRHPRDRPASLRSRISAYVSGIRLRWGLGAYALPGLSPPNVARVPTYRGQVLSAFTNGRGSQQAHRPGHKGESSTEFDSPSRQFFILTVLRFRHRPLEFLRSTEQGWPQRESLPPCAPKPVPYALHFSTLSLA